MGANNVAVLENLKKSATEERTIKMGSESLSGENYQIFRLKDVEIGEGTVIHDQVNLYKCKIGKNCKIDSFVYVEEGVIIGDICKIRPFVFIPSGVTIEDNVFVGPNVTFTNDKYPKVKENGFSLRSRLNLVLL